MHIYKTTNTINGKVYIGQTIKKKYNTYLGSGVKLLLAIKKYGRKSFTREILEWCETKQELDKKEVFWVEYYKSTDDAFGYNISKGGQRKGKDVGHKHSLDTIEKLKNASKGRYTLKWYVEKYGEVHGTIEYKNHISRMKSYHTGKSSWNKGLTKNTHNGLKEMSEKASSRKRKKCDDTTKSKISNSMRGKNTLEYFISKHGEEVGFIKYNETKKLSSIGRKGKPAWNSGTAKPKESKPLSETQIKRIESRRRNGWNKRSLK